MIVLESIQYTEVVNIKIYFLSVPFLAASAHVKLASASDYDSTSNKIKEFFHDEGIHSTTVQIEYNRKDDVDRRGPCMVVCSLDSACDEMMCCKPDQSGE